MIIYFFENSIAFIAFESVRIENVILIATSALSKDFNFIFNDQVLMKNKKQQISKKCDS